jgi:hypothetical protein
VLVNQRGKNRIGHKLTSRFKTVSEKLEMKNHFVFVWAMLDLLSGSRTNLPLFAINLQPKLKSPYAHASSSNNTRQHQVRWHEFQSTARGIKSQPHTTERFSNSTF